MNKKLLSINSKSFLALILTFILTFSVFAPTVMAVIVDDDTPLGYDTEYEKENNIEGEVLDFSDLEKFDFKDQIKEIKNYVRDNGFYSISKKGHDYTIKLQNLTVKKIILPYDDADGGKPFYKNDEPRQTHITIILEGSNNVTGYGISGGYTKGVTITGDGSLNINAYKEVKVQRFLDMKNVKDEERINENFSEDRYQTERNSYIVPGIVLETDEIRENDEKSGFIFESGVRVTINSPYYWGIICNGDIKFKSNCNVSISSKSGAIAADRIYKEDNVTLNAEKILVYNKKEDSKKEPVPEEVLNDKTEPLIIAKGIQDDKVYCFNPQITVVDDVGIAKITINNETVSDLMFIENEPKRKTFDIPLYMDANKTIIATDLAGNTKTLTFTSHSDHITLKGKYIAGEPATCEKPGYHFVEYTCLICNEVARKDKIIDPTIDHIYGDWINISPTQDKRTCTKCNHSETRDISVNMAKTTISLSNSDYIYDGTEKTPDITVKDGNKTLIKGTDFVTNYSNNIKVGTATVTVTGINRYVGSVTKQFTIKAEVKKEEPKNSEETKKVEPKINDEVKKVEPKVQNNDVTIDTTNSSTNKVEDTNTEVAPSTFKNNIPTSSSTTVLNNIENEQIDNVITASNITKTYSAKSQSFKINVNQLGNGNLTFKSNNKSVTVTNSGKVTIKAKFVGKATITITSSETAEYNKATKKITITVNPSKVSISKLSNVKGKKLTIKWKKNSVCSGYQIQVSTDKNFKKNVKTITIKKNSTVSKTINKLTKNKKYYVRIRGFKTVSKVNYYSSWSSIKNIKIKK